MGGRFPGQSWDWRIMTNFEWFLLIVVVIVVPLIVAVVVTLWTIDQANKRKRANRADAQIGVKRKAALSPEEVEARKAERAKKLAEDHDGPTSGDEATGEVVPPPLPLDVSRETSAVAEDPRTG
jgi:uncharacterized membrane protein